MRRRHIPEKQRANQPASGGFYSQKMDDGVGSIYYVIKERSACLRAG
jgi:hypothetical protein